MTEIIELPITTLKPWGRNPRKHDIDRIIKSINHFGFRAPLVVNKVNGDYIVEAGHGRLIAAKRLGLKTLPCVVVEDDEQTAAAYAIADNRLQELTEWDMPGLKDILEELDNGSLDLDTIGFNDKELEDLMTQFHVPAEGLTDDDAVPEEVESICKTGDLWQLGDHRLLCGDATKIEDVERLMAGEKADMVFTDPPYGLGDKKSFNNDYPNYKDDCTFDITILDLGQEWVVWGGNYYDILPLPRNTIGWIVWDKRPTQEDWDDKKRQDADRRFGQHFEIAITNLSELRGKILRKRWGGYYGTSGHPEDKLVHKTQKPIELATLCIQQRHNIILDYFGGSGSTLIACEKLGRKCRMMEIDETYSSVIIKRWEAFTSKKAVKLDG